MYTSYFSNSDIKNYSNLVAISRTVPMNYIGKRYILLAPTENLLWNYKNKTLCAQEFSLLYTRTILDKLHPRTVLDTLGTDAVLLCWEKPAEFCHRQLVAQWLTENLECSITEL